MISLGIALAFLAAIAYGVRDVFQKESVVQTNPYVSAWSKRTFTLLVTGPALIYTGIPAVNWNTLMVALPVSVFVNFVAAITVAKAYNREEVSFLAPLGALSPVPILITAPVILGEWPSLYGYLGVFLIVCGTYLLKFDDMDVVLPKLAAALRTRSLASLMDALELLFKPLKRVYTNRAAQLIVLTLLLYSFSSVYDKIGVLGSSPILWSTMISAGSAVILTPLMAYKTTGVANELRQGFRPLLVLGILTGAGSLIQMTALEHTLVVYLSAIKRFSIPISVVLGYLVYNETNLRGRGIGTVLVLLGGVVIAFS